MAKISKYRFAGVPQKITFNVGLAVMEFIPDAECVVRYHKDKDTEFKFFVLTSESASCRGDQYKDFVEIEVHNGRENLFAIGDHTVMELEEESDPTKVEVRILGSKILKKGFRISSLAK